MGDCKRDTGCVSISSDFADACRMLVPEEGGSDVNVFVCPCLWASVEEVGWWVCGCGGMTICCSSQGCAAVLEWIARGGGQSTADLQAAGRRVFKELHC